MSDRQNRAVDATVNFVAPTDDPNIWKIVFVETGPWDDIPKELHRLQERLYDCIEGAIDGALAEQYPDTNAKAITLQLEGCDLPEKDVREFWNAFSSGVVKIPEFASALANSPYVTGFNFELNLD